MLDLEILIGKLLAIDALATHAVSHGEVACEHRKTKQSRKVRQKRNNANAP